MPPLTRQPNERPQGLLCSLAPEVRCGHLACLLSTIPSSVSVAAASQALQQQAAKGKADDLGVLADVIATWLAYEERVKEVSDWPYSDQTRRGLGVSMLLPAAVGVAQTVLLELVRRLLPA